MPGRPRRGGPETPKTPSSVSGRSVQNLHRPKAFRNVNEDSNDGSVRTSTPTSTPERSTRSSRSRASAQKSRAFISKLAYKVNAQAQGNRASDDEEDEEDYHDEDESQKLGSDDSDLASRLNSAEPSSDEDDPAGISEDEDNDDEDEDKDEDGIQSEDEKQSVASSVSRKKIDTVALLALDEPVLPKIELPKSSDDLNMELEYLMDVVAIYETLRHYQAILRLSPFRLEDFCVALKQPEQSCLLGEVHMSLLKALLREEDANNTTFGPQDLMHSINISFMFMDSMTWPELVRAYLESERCWEFQLALDAYNECGTDYPYADIKTKIIVLKTLSDMFLASNAVREEIVNEGHIQYDDHCRACHKLGDLLCCETCPAVYHLTCVEPPLTEVPEDDWLCAVCKAHQLKGVVDCVADTERAGAMCRQDPLGYDRHRRKYWFICRRIIVEDYTTGEVWYYSTPRHVNELLQVLDSRKDERSLARAITMARDDMEKQMGITVDLTKKAAGKGRGCVIEDEANELAQLQRQRAGITDEDENDGEDKKTEAEEESKGEKEKMEKEEKIEKEEKMEEEKMEEEKVEEEKMEEEKMEEEAKDETDSVEKEEESIEKEDESMVNGVVEEEEEEKPPKSIEEMEAESGIVDPESGLVDPESGEIVPRPETGENEMEDSVDGVTDEKKSTGNKPTVTVISAFPARVAVPPAVQPVPPSGDSGTTETGAAPAAAGTKVSDVKETTSGQVNRPAPAPKATAMTEENKSRVAEAIKMLSEASKGGASATETQSKLEEANKYLLKQGRKIELVQAMNPNVGPGNKSKVFVLRLVDVKKPTAQSAETSESLNQSGGSSGSVQSGERPESACSKEGEEEVGGPGKMVTRSRTGSQRPKHFADAVVSLSGSVKMTSKTGLIVKQEDDELKNLVVPDDMLTSRPDNTRLVSRTVLKPAVGHERIVRSSERAYTPVIITLPKPQIPMTEFRLGDEFSYRNYVNQYTTNNLALNKPQHNEEKDKRRHLSYKFSLTQASEFKWFGNLCGNSYITIVALRNAINHMESQLPPAFLHPNWPLHLKSWKSGVMNCSRPEDFGQAMILIEACMKPCLFTYAWRESLGHLKLQRVTAMEREEMKKREKERKKKEDDEEVDKSSWVKYPKGLKHQIWKQRGEEYRLTGQGGWCWLSNRRTYRYKPYRDIGLLGVAKRRRLERELKSGARPSSRASNHADDLEHGSDVIPSLKQTLAITMKPVNLDGATGIRADSLSENKEPTGVQPELSAVSNAADNKPESPKKSEETGGVKDPLEKEVKSESNDKKVETDVQAVETESTVKKETVKSSIFDSVGKEIEKVADEVNALNGTLDGADNEQEEEEEDPDLHQAEKMVENLSQETEVNKKDNDLAKTDQSASEDQDDDDVINVTVGLKERKLYPRGKKPYARLDNLLDKRLRMHADEMRRKTTLMNLLNKLQEMKVKLASGENAEESDKNTDKEIEETKEETKEAVKEKNNEESGEAKAEKDSDVRFAEQAAEKKTETNPVEAAMETSVEEKPDSTETPETGKTPMETEDQVPVKQPVETMETEPATVQNGDETLPEMMSGALALEKTMQNTESADKPDEAKADVETEKTPTPVDGAELNAESADKPDVETEKTPTPIDVQVTDVKEDGKIDAENTENPEIGSEIKSDENSGSKSDQKSEIKWDEKKMNSENAEKPETKSDEKSSTEEKSESDKIAEAARISSEQLSQALKHLASLSDDKLNDLRKKMPKDRSTRDPVRIIQHRGCNKRSKFRRGLLPPQENFHEKDSRLNILLLDWYSRKRMARSGGFRETEGFNYNCKMANVNWNYPCPRPSIQRVWRYKSQGLRTLAGASLQLRVLWTCIRWDDINIKPPVGGISTVSTDMDVTTRELLKRKDIGPYQMKSEYYIRKVIVPLSASQADSKDRDYTPIRSGLRQRKRPDSPKTAEPTMEDYWVPETKLDLWEIKLFHEKLERQRQSQLRKDTKTQIPSKNPADLKNQLEDEIKKQRLMVTQKRLLEGKPPDSPARSTVSILPSTVITRSATGARKIIIRSNSAFSNVGSPVTSSLTSSGVIQLKDGGKGSVLKTAGTDTTSVKAMLESKHAKGGKLTSPGADKIIHRPPPVSSVTFSVVAGPPPPGEGATKLGEETTGGQSRPSGAVSVTGLKPGQHLVKTPDGRLTVIQLPAGQCLKPGTTVTMNHRGPPSGKQINPRPVIRPDLTQTARPLFIQTKQGLRPLRPAAAGVSLLRPAGVLQSPPKIVIRPALNVVSPSFGAQLPQSVQPISDLPGNQSFTVSPQVIQQVVQRALLQQNQTPEIQAKLRAIQQKMGGGPADSVRTPQSIRESSRPIRSQRPRDDDFMDIDEALYQLDPDDEPYRPYHGGAETGEKKSKRSKLKDGVFMDKIKESKPKKLAKVRPEASQEKQKRVISGKLQTILYKHKEALKKDILRKRAVLDKALHADVSNELIQRQKEIRKQRKRALHDSLTGGATYQLHDTSQHITLPACMDTESENNFYEEVKPKKKKKQKIISTGGNESEGKRGRGSNKLYCVCKTPYDETQFYIGCDMCSNWFHGDCVNISETDSQMLSSYVCQECRHQRENRAEELYCLCRKPYDETQFYIGCDECQDWFHVECVGIEKAEADTLDFYLCPRCKESSDQNVVEFANTELDRRTVDGLKRLVRSLAAHKMAWPFLDPVDEREAPDYYDVIKEPMDLSTVEKKLLSAAQYHVIGDVMKDVTKIFDNCRYYNSNDSHVFQCAESLEDFYREKLKQFKQKVVSGS